MNSMKLSAFVWLLILLLYSLSSFSAEISLSRPNEQSDTLEYVIINNFRKERSVVLALGDQITIQTLTGKKYKGKIDSLQEESIYINGEEITQYQIKKIKSSYTTRKKKVLKILLGITAGIGILALLVGFVFSENLGLSVSGSGFNDTTSFIIIPGIILGVLAFILALDQANTVYKSSKPGRYELLLVPKKELQESVRFYSE